MKRTANLLCSTRKVDKVDGIQVAENLCDYVQWKLSQRAENSSATANSLGFLIFCNWRGLIKRGRVGMNEIFILKENCRHRRFIDFAAFGLLR